MHTHPRGDDGAESAALLSAPYTSAGFTPAAVNIAITASRLRCTSVGYTTPDPTTSHI
jgi:hypothetical protein